MAAMRERDFVSNLRVSCQSAAGGASCPYTTVAPGDPGTRDDGLQGQADEAGARTARRWFLVGLPLALAYLVVVFRFHRGKAVAARDGESY
jgi:hypothetical protein